MTATTPETATLSPGFRDPVIDSQATFRRLMEAFAYPGRVLEIPARLSDLPPGLTMGMACVALTLFDGDTPIWLDPALRTTTVEGYLKFHCGCPLVLRPSDATFAVVANPTKMPRLDEFALGLDQYPDRSTTVLIDVPALTGASTTFDVCGPGIRSLSTLSILGLPDGFRDDWEANSQRFPLGVDLLFVSAHSVLALPRSTKIR